MRNQKSINLLNHFHNGLSAPDTESNHDRLLQVLRLKEKCLQVRQVEEKKAVAMGKGGGAGGITDFFFILSLISFFFSFSKIQSPSPVPCRAAAQPRAALHGLNPDQLQAPLELHTEREEKRKKHVCEKERERETLDDRQSFLGGICHSKTQQREVEC